MPTGRRTSSVVVAVTLALIGLYVAVPTDAVRAAIWMIAGSSATTAILVAYGATTPRIPCRGGCSPQAPDCSPTVRPSC